MAELTTLTVQDLETLLLGDKPMLVLFSNGQGLRGDFSTAFKKAVDENPTLSFAKIDPSVYPELAARFEVGDKPVLFGWYCGDEILRRLRPWGSDVPLAIDMIKNAVKDRQPETESIVMETAVEPIVDKQMMIEDHPVIVTDATFEQEVLNHDKPVLVDFWAEWCGPCRMVAPTLEKLAKEFAGQIRIAKVNVDENPGVAQAFRVMSIPNIMIIKNKTMIFNQPGALPEPAFRDLIKQAITLDMSKVPAQQQPAQ